MPKVIIANFDRLLYYRNRPLKENERQARKRNKMAKKLSIFYPSWSVFMDKKVQKQLFFAGDQKPERP